MTPLGLVAFILLDGCAFRDNAYLRLTPLPPSILSHSLLNFFRRNIFPVCGSLLNGDRNSCPQPGRFLPLGKSR